jgi:adenylate cyclase
MTHRQRRDWRIIFWVTIASAAISAWFGYVIVPEGGNPLVSATIGILTSLVIATPIIIFEVKSPRWRFMRALRRLPLAVYFGVRVLFYLTIIGCGLLLARHIRFTTSASDDVALGESFLFAIIMTVTGNLIFQMGALLGFGTLKSILTGRYVQPRPEMRAFLMVDMKDSTGLAERLGPVRFHALLNDFFGDVADAALETGAEIHKYVGDEAILTWRGERALRDGDCLACPFLVRDFIAGNAERYRRRFGAVPGFRAALHYGEIVAGEIGDVRREIAYVGDTLNVAARLLDAAREKKCDVLASAEVLERSGLPPNLRAETLPTLAVRGRAAPLGVSALASSS